MASQKKLVGLDGLRMSPGLSLIERRKILGTLTLQSEWVKIADYFEASSDKLLHAAREQQLEGIVGTLRDSRYEPGKPSGAWIKHRLNLGQEFVLVRLENPKRHPTLPEVKPKRRTQSVPR